MAESVSIDLLAYERRLWDKGVRLVAGVDEAGVGPLAGPVIAAAVILPIRLEMEGVRDSKTLSASQRARAEVSIHRHALTSGIGEADIGEIRELNIYHASLLAMRRALEQLSPPPEFVLADARRIPCIPWPQEKIIRGDALSQSIAAASILAKEHRDRLMKEYDRLYPLYGFAQHKGYPTAQHRKALETHGPCPIHRDSFAALAKFCGRPQMKS